MLKSVFDKVAGLNAWNKIKKKLQHRCFPVKFVKISRAPFFKGICVLLLLNGLTSIKVC